ncbi:MAG TPA: serine/threonine-protein kinase [Kofleriaceae bacterium]|nr:serine/threonine-protein kinase [Kofleriaceae bacterium]
MWLDVGGITDATVWRGGDRVDRYELIEQIGVGGMGVVWSALDLDLGREVAIKLSFPRLHVRLLGEAQAMARLSHPNVVTVHDVGWTRDGLFIAMERIDGGTLGDWLRAVPRAWDEVIEKFAGAGRGLAAAHRAGLVHRDFKPENVLVGVDGVARVSDFGLAVPLGEARRDEARGGAGQRSSTQELAPVGTLAYMAPEQLCGYAVTPGSDQFSFCLALHEALYRVTAFGPAWSEAPAVFFLAAASEGRIAPPPPDSRVPAPIRDVVMRGLAFQPDDRWPSMEVLVAELERCRPRGRKP